MNPDSGEMDAALIAKLQADAELRTLMPDGAWFDSAPTGAKRFVLVTIFDAVELGVFGGRAIEQVLYLVQAVALASLNPNMKAAAKRIDDLLADQPFTVNGYSFMTCYRDEPGRHRPPDEIDEQDSTIRWKRRGGYYRMVCAIPDK